MTSAGETFARADRTIIYVEDTESNVRLVARILAKRPRLRLLTASNGTDGLELTRSTRPDLVLLDMHLPDIDGLDVLNALRADPATSAIAIAALSADATKQRIEAVLAAGAVDYITKPITVNDFLARIDALIDALPPRDATTPG